MKSILIFSCFLFTGVAFSQDAYIFSTFTDPYTEFSDGTSLVEEGWIEPQFSIPLGFDFTSLNVTSDMLVSDDVGGTYSILNANESASAVFGVLEYIVDGAVVNGAQASTIGYKVVGVEGSQICKVQLTDCAFFYEIYGGEASADNRMSYQIWLYEGSNAVEIRFGPSEIPNPQLAFEGNSGPIVVFIAGVENDIVELAEYGTFLEGAPEDPVLAELNFDFYPPGLDAMPESGRVYRFEPNVLSTQETMSAVFEIYPTLVQNELNVDSEFSGPQRYHIHDINGRRLISEVISPPCTINVRDLTKGVYLLSFENYGGAQKFVKQ